MNDAKLSRMNPHAERSVAVAAGCDPRTVRAYLRGESTRSTTAARIAQALRSLGFEAAPDARDAAPSTAAD